MEPPRSEDRRLYEIIRFFMYDIGRSVDLAAAAVAIRGAGEDEDSPSVRVAKRRDTPASLSLPKPLVAELQGGGPPPDRGIGDFSARLKIYDDGAITVVIRYFIEAGFSELAPLDELRAFGPEGDQVVAEYADGSFRAVRDLISSHVTDPISQEQCERETYIAYCLLESREEPAEFLGANREAAASLLIGEPPELPLHEIQIAAALTSPFSYTRKDLSIFDMDRCIIIDPSRDYEDILLIIEHANYQLLELRALDKLLDARLDDAEKELVRQSSGLRRRRSGASPEMKLARIQKLRFEALFVLENLENSSKIIGDYYLGQIYARLCGIFNTQGWMRSVDRRSDALRSIYEMVKTDSAEQRTLVLEIVFIAVCVIFPVLQIIQVLIQG